MTRPAPVLVQADLFGADEPVAVAVAPEASVPIVRPKRRRRADDSQRAGLAAVTKEGPTLQTRCLWDIAGNSKQGRTRQEIANRTGIKLQTVCGRVDRLLKAELVFEPVIGYDRRGRALHFMRDGGKVVVDARFRGFDWLKFGLLLPGED